MSKEFIVKVPDLLKSKGMSIEELRWGAKLSLNTAKKWADYDQAQTIDRIDVPTLINIAEFFDTNKIEDLLEIR
ncbi:MAG: hypothetical protein SVT56_03790 [Chloroflexota bacterium]|nr:hypothetical protein [Chloroflexota bacterium]